MFGSAGVFRGASSLCDQPSERIGRVGALDELGVENELSRFIVAQAEVDDALEKLCARIVKDRVRPIVAARKNFLALHV